jgi:hypothetical protein
MPRSSAHRANPRQRARKFPKLSSTAGRTARPREFAEQVVLDTGDVLRRDRRALGVRYATQWVPVGQILRLVETAVR